MASKPIDPKLLAWFKGYVARRGWMAMGHEHGFSPHTIQAIMDKGAASSGTIARMMAIQQDMTGERARIARQNAARIIESASYFLPDRQQAIMDALGPDVLDDMAVNSGALLPRPAKNKHAAKV